MSVRSALLVAVFSFVSLSASAAWQPGLNYGSVSGAANWTAYPTSPTNVLGPMMATTTSGWGANTTYVYWGQIYLDGSRYNFAESIDDGTMLVIDGETLIKDTAWNKTITASIMRPAGWYSFEVRFYNGGSGAGPANQDGWGTTDFGFGYNKNGSTGKASSGYTFPMEPGDLTLFRYDDGTGFDDCIEVSASPEKIALDDALHLRRGCRSGETLAQGERPRELRRVGDGAQPPCADDPRCLRGRTQEVKQRLRPAVRPSRQHHFRAEVGASGTWSVGGCPF